ncbi:hypothetical protein BT63DRAFT_190403 [Microthyrium microscopicum]|uniref:Uncharacterized protein n=1 Tax=Microthyrium microscopicum TaxID=703497 RepID=A0A6A6UKB1_9PEZI|nr:hypothetical protein BT63DRAFT_190403 [Microthyrium microscopicum]
MMWYPYTVALVATMLSSTLAACTITTGALTASLSTPKPNADCPCWTYTHSLRPFGCPPPASSLQCPTFSCLVTTTSYVPASNTACPATPTTTVYLPCLTGCPGCFVTTESITLGETCLPTPTQTA